MFQPETYIYIYIKPHDNILIPSTHLCFSSTNSVFGSTQGTGVEHAVLARLIDSLCRSNCRMTLDSFSCKVSRSSSNYNILNIIPCIQMSLKFIQIIDNKLIFFRNAWDNTLVTSSVSSSTRNCSAATDR